MGNFVRSILPGVASRWPRPSSRHPSPRRPSALPARMAGPPARRQDRLPPRAVTDPGRAASRRRGRLARPGPLGIFAGADRRGQRDEGAGQDASVKLAMVPSSGAGLILRKPIQGHSPRLSGATAARVHHCSISIVRGDRAEDRFPSLFAGFANPITTADAPGTELLCRRRFGGLWCRGRRDQVLWAVQNFHHHFAGFARKRSAGRRRGLSG